ncbi:ATP-binding protein [Thermodesulfovibrio yellowstonii]|uniref:Helicase HerA central domain-containing protein n=1 Tax=Thermodesulfovibrio yellowstonii TaxID=28262 RepID=A0A9W6GIH1_9BACT|nr:DUF87 domain-containing protein [Thermodesulfovibrio islandicus]GLI54476.1 hypothetical protein TISLANDTSLP1_21690 [Thermodesulfovibrio islandicus]
MKDFFEKAAFQDHPLRVLESFLQREEAYEKSKQYERMRFVGYVLEIGYDTITIITSDPFKIAVGGIPRNSLLIMVPSNYKSLPPHFTLLRVLEAAPTPLSNEVQQTYFELQKKSMPELDVFTQSELQWGALKTAVLGMFYSHPSELNKVEFSGDLNNFVSAHKYRVYAPDNELLDLIVNSMVPQDSRFPIGDLRLTECRMFLPDKPSPNVKVYVSTKDFMGTRTALFGKTRLGKSNVVKLIAQSLIETTGESRNVGQLIFDINGEYANDNPQDNNLSLRSVYPDKCIIYAITPKDATPSRPLKINFYEHPEKAQSIIKSLLEQDGKLSSSYVSRFTSVELPSLEEVAKLPVGPDRIRLLRKIQIFWAILKKAGYSVNERQLLSVAPTGGNTSRFNPGFSDSVRNAAYQSCGINAPLQINTLDELIRELECINKLRRTNPRLCVTSSGNNLFDADDEALLEFLDPLPGRAGAALIQPYRIYNDSSAGDFINEIIQYLDSGMTVILDLGNANPEVMSYFSNELSMAVFRHQVNKFSNNRLGNHYIQLYFEEAHNLFPQSGDVTTIYSRLAKEGAKYHIGMVYSTQSPTTINKDLLAQTENFFVAHLSSRDDVNLLAKVNIAYDSLKDDILQAKTVGYLRILTRSHRFVVPVQIRKFEPTQKGVADYAL